jgi:hypothetical protein
MIDELRKALQEAMKRKDTARASTLRMMLTELTTKEKEHGQPVSEEGCLAVFSSMVRKREEAIEQFRHGGRDDLADREQQEIAVIKEFLPEQLSEEEIRDEARAVIAELGAENMKAMGKVMGVLTKKLAGKAQGGTISTIVKQELSR